MEEAIEVAKRPECKFTMALNVTKAHDSPWRG